MTQKHKVEIPGTITDAICCNIDAFSDCVELIALSKRSVQRVGRTSYQRKWTEKEIKQVIDAINVLLSNKTKYPNSAGREYDSFVEFRDQLESSLT